MKVYCSKIDCENIKDIVNSRSTGCCSEIYLAISKEGTCLNYIEQQVLESVDIHVHCTVEKGTRIDKYRIKQHIENFFRR